MDEPTTMKKAIEAGSKAIQDQLKKLDEAAGGDMAFREGNIAKETAKLPSW